MKDQIEQKLLITAARELAEILNHRFRPSAFKVRAPWRVGEGLTEGWYASIGSQGKNKPKLALWYDRFLSEGPRAFYLCFHSRKSMIGLVRKVEGALGEVRTVDATLVTKKEPIRLLKRPTKTQKLLPIYETYDGPDTYLGIYDAAPSKSLSVAFTQRVVAFIECVLGPPRLIDEDDLDVYSRIENRRQVVTHLHRERSPWLAARRKERDRFTCQVCERTARSFGALGQAAMEAHHVVPLSKVQHKTLTTLNDLRTVCATCHRMLHKMTGRKSDISKLKALLKQKKILPQ